jgi:hypothetical protein
MNKDQTQPLYDWRLHAQKQLLIALLFHFSITGTKGVDLLMHIVAFLHIHVLLKKIVGKSANQHISQTPGVVGIQGGAPAVR